MGVRKVMGSTRSQIILQQLAECLFIVMTAIAVSILINTWWLPSYNSMFNNVHVTADYRTDYTLLAVLGILLLAVTFLAGGYPAFYISRFNASDIFRGGVKFGGSNVFSRILLGLQITISFITVIAGLAFSRNASFQKNYDYGYNKDNIIGMFVQSANDYHALRNELDKINGIEMIAGTRQHIGFSQRTASLESAGQQKESQYLEVGENYLNTLQLKLTAGRDFNAAGQGDIERSMLINQHLAFQFGWKDNEAIGKQIKIDTNLCTVVGVLKDFAPQGFFMPVGPVALRLVAPAKYAQLIIRTKPRALTTVFGQLRETWPKLFPLKPFSGYYQSESTAQSIRTNDSIATIFFWFSMLAVLFAATGLFALISLTILKKRKEIAIRKVVGATPRHIYQLILKGYAPVFLLAAGLGCYAGYQLSKLLMDMIFRINAGVNTATLGISFTCMLCIIAATAGIRIWAAFRAKSTNLLKGE